MEKSLSKFIGFVNLYEAMSYHPTQSNLTFTLFPLIRPSNIILTLSLSITVSTPTYLKFIRIQIDLIKQLYGESCVNYEGE